MSRRSTVEKVLIATANVTSGASPVELVAAVADNILAPDKAVVAAGGSAALVTFTHGSGSTLFLTLRVPANDSRCIPFPAGLELLKGDEIDVSTDQTVDVTLYYNTYDEGAGITKVQSRANTYNNVTATRAPSNVVGQSKS